MAGRTAVTVLTITMASAVVWPSPLRDRQTPPAAALPGKGAEAISGRPAFVAPFGGNLHVRLDSREAAALEWRLGTGATAETCRIHLSDVTGGESPEVLIGPIAAGEPLHFCMFTRFAGSQDWAFSNAVDRASVTAFTDRDNSLGLGGSIIRQSSPNTWTLHLDDAASYLYDDDDNDIVVQLRIETTDPPPPVPNGQAEALRMYASQANHVVVASVVEERLERRPRGQYHRLHQRAQVVRSYKGLWRPSDVVRFMTALEEIPAEFAETDVVRDAGRFVLLFLPQRTESEVFLDVGYVWRYQPALRPLLEGLSR